MKTKLHFSLFILLITLVWVLSDAQAPAKPLAEDGSRVARLLANSLPLMHLNKVAWDDALAEKALDNYLEALDFEKVFFLASDIQEFRAYRTEIDDLVKRGDLSFAQQVYDVLKERVADRMAYAEILLEQPLNLETEESYAWKRKDADWPENREAWDDLWRKRIKHLYLSRLVSTDGEDADGLLEDIEEEKRSHSDIVNASLSPVDYVRRTLERFRTVMMDNDETWVIERYLTAFAQAFDPHTDFMSPNNLQDFEINMSLSLQGIGAMLSNEDGAAKVERLIPGGPAEMDGRLKPGDKIIAVAQGDEEPVDVLHWPLYKTVRLIRGEKGSKVVLTIIPASDPGGATLDLIDLIRDEVKLEEQAAKGEMKNTVDEHGNNVSIGVITLPDFYSDFNGGQKGQGRSCTRDVERILRDLLDQGAQGIVLDLRNNGGGSLTEAIDLTGLFIETGPVVQVRDRRHVRALFDRNSTIVYGGPLVVMVNRLSASASEIVAGALQDYGRAVIVGDTKTHGKGTVQTLTPLSSANPQLGSVKVTTASFYRIAGGSTQLRGVTPDIVIPSFMETLEVGEDHLHNALPYSTVDRLDYQPVRETASLVDQLSRLSIQRREQDPRFQSYGDLMEKSRERQEEKTISLLLEKRRQLAASEKELREQIEETDPETGKKDDLILREVVEITRDLIRIEHDEAIAGENDAATPASAAL